MTDRKVSLADEQVTGGQMKDRWPGDRWESEFGKGADEQVGFSSSLGIRHLNCK